MAHTKVTIVKTWQENLLEKEYFEEWYLDWKDVIEIDLNETGYGVKWCLLSTD